MPERAANRSELDAFIEARMRQASASVAGGPASLQLKQKLLGVASGEALRLGRYTLLRLLGEGAMGSVYEALDTARNQRVALKVFRHVGPHTARLLKREFRALSDVVHPNLLVFYELSAQGETCYFTMELIEGVDFVSYVRGKGGSRARTAAARLELLRGVTRQLAAGVLALHSRGKVHRDLKPSNVLVTREGRVVVLDFGLITSFDARARDITFGGQIVGTPAYMAPEQFRADAVTPASDCYALGGMLFHALTGAPPFAEYAQHEIGELRASRVPEFPPGADYGLLGELCLLLLKPDPAERADCATLLQRLGEDALDSEQLPDTRGPTRERSGFIGRPKELGVLSAALSAAAEGCVTVLVAGAVGTGKSHLLETFLAGLDANQYTLLTAKCYEHESLPYKSLDGLIDSLVQFMLQLPPVEVAALLPRYANELTALFPALARVASFALAPKVRGAIADEQEHKRRAVLALQELLAKVAERSPLVICIEDLHWGDRDSAAVIRRILMSPDAPRCLCIGTVSVRDGVDVARLVGRFLNCQQLVSAELNVRVVRLAPLTRDEGTRLARSVSPDLDEARAAQIADRAAGNPLLIRQLAEFAGQLPSWSTTAPASLREMVAANVARFSPEALLLLRVLALAGGSLEASLAALVADRRRGASIVAQELRAAQLMRSGPSGTLELTHHELAPAILEGLEPPTLRDLHARLVTALSERGAPHDERLLVHLQGAGRSAEAAAHAIERAEHAARALAYERAAELYGLGLKLGPADGCIEQLKLKRAEALHHAGHGRDAARAFLDAANASADADRATQLRLRAAEHFLLSGDLDQGRALLRSFMVLPQTRLQTMVRLVASRALLRLRGIRFCPNDAEKVASAALLRLDQGWSLVRTLLLVDPLLGRLVQTRELLQALRVREPSRVLRALAGEAVSVAAGRGANGREKVLAMLNLTGALGKQLGQPHARATAAMCGAAAAYLVGEPEHALKVAAEAERLLREECVEVDFELGVIHLVILRAQMMLGQFGELCARAQDAICEVQQRGSLALAAALRVHTHLACLVVDDLDGAKLEIAAALREWPHDEVHLQNLVVLGGETRSSLYVGDGVAAFRHLHEIEPRLRRSPIRKVGVVRSDLSALRGRAAGLAYAQTGERGYRRAALREAQHLQQERFRGATGWALMTLAAVAAGDRALPAALRLLGSAAQSFERDSMPFFAQVARYQVALASGRSAEADAPLATFSRAGVRNPRAFARMLSGFPDPSTEL